MSSTASPDVVGVAGKVALVTGGGAGIGRAIAELYAQAGMRVAVVEIDPSRAADVQAALGPDALVVTGDVRIEADVRRTIDAVNARFERLDVLVNNVGDFLQIRGEFSDSTDDEWERLYAINLLHVFRVTRAAIPLMKASGGGSIISISTVEAFRGIPLCVAYSAFNAGITGFTQSLSVELGRYGIRVNAIAPETTDTAQIVADSRVPAENRERIELWFPLRRFGRAADTAGSALFLASERLSGWMTGSTLTVDGGVMAAGAWMRMPQAKGWTHLPMIEGDGYTPRPDKRQRPPRG